MPLEQSDLDQIKGLITDSFSDFLKTQVAPMVSGATKRALSEAPQLTADTLQEQLETLTRNLQEQAKPVDTAKLVQDSVNAVLQQLADMPDEDQPAGAAGAGKQAQAVDADALREQIKRELEESTKAENAKFRKQLEAMQAKAEAAEQAAEAERQRSLIANRDKGFVESLLKTGAIDPGAGQLALQAAISAGHIIPHPENPGEFVVKEKDSLGLDDVYVPATDRLEQILDKPELQYFRPARSGTGTGASPARNLRPQSGPQLQVLPSEGADELSADALFQAMQADPGKVLADLAALDKAS